jgi:hypothetical protein
MNILHNPMRDPNQKLNFDSRTQFGRLAIVTVLVVGILLPPFYLFVMVQYGAREFPYWDHMATAKQIVEYFDGTLTFHSLLEAQSQARPLFPRLIFIANAALTKWDIRSEYVYIYLTVYGVLAALLAALRRISKDWPNLNVLTTALLISIIACSPVGAMNYYWSLMLLATLSYFCTIVAFLAVSENPFSWRANILAAALGWIAAYSISQGLLVFPVIFMIHQLIAARKFVLNRWSAFWLANLIVCYSLYFPGLTTDVPLPPRPALLDFLGFVAVYIGNPLGSLLWFPHMGAILLRHTIIINGVCGALLLGLTGYTAWRAWPELSARRPEVLIFLALSVFAGACAMLTGLGRANGPEPIAVANSSRYSIFAACMLFGLIFYYAAKLARNEIAFSFWKKALIGFFVIASVVSYFRGIEVYRLTHDDNEWLANVYGPDAEPTDLDRRAYPDASYFDPLRADLLRLGIGPYRRIPQVTAAIYDGALLEAIPIKPGTVITQRFRSAYRVVRSVSFQVVNWGKAPAGYRVRWSAVGLKDGSRTEIGAGSFSTVYLADWQTVTLKLNGSSEASEVEVTLTGEGSAAITNFIGIALYSPGADPFSPAVIDGVPREDGSKVGFRVYYRK